MLTKRPFYTCTQPPGRRVAGSGNDKAGKTVESTESSRGLEGIYGVVLFAAGEFEVRISNYLYLFSDSAMF